MANTRSAEKRNRQSEKRRARNQGVRTRVKSAVKKVRETLERGELAAAQEHPEPLLCVGGVAAQHAADPAWYAVARSRSLPYSLRPVEFTQPLSPFPGAHNFAFRHAPPSPFTNAVGAGGAVINNQSIGKDEE